LDRGNVTDIVQAERRSVVADEREARVGFARRTPEMMGGK
jgi:hypothetical protein